MHKETEIKAHLLMDRLSDHKSALGFHYNAIKLLGFQRCYELASIALEAYKSGKVRTTLARYYNGCIKKELIKKSY